MRALVPNIKLHFKPFHGLLVSLVLLLGSFSTLAFAQYYDEDMERLNSISAELDRMSQLLDSHLANNENVSTDSMPPEEDTTDESTAATEEPDAPSAEAQTNPVYQGVSRPVNNPLDEPSDDACCGLSGEVIMGMGLTSEDLILRNAYFDLNERNFRMLSDEGPNNKENTYDPAIYDRMKFNIDYQSERSPLTFHGNITVDPWSYTAKSDKISVAGNGGDLAEFELFYSANSPYSINQTIFTLQNGDSFNFPNMKLTGDRLLPTSITSTFGNTFNIPEIDLDFQFQPVREFWFDYAPDEDSLLRFFPMAYQDAALTTDDPLKLSNNKMYWEESPWLASWRSGHVNTAAVPEDFFKGAWDDSLAFATRDSDGTRLTALRGVALSFAANESTTIDAVIATPKTLWQEYEIVDAIPGSFRIKSFLADNFYVGNVTNMHLGFSDRELDAYNTVVGFDSGYAFNPNTKIEAQLSLSVSEQDLTNAVYESKKRGNAYYLGLTTSDNPQDDILQGDYFHIKPTEKSKNFFQSRLFYAHMDEGFESTLSNYHQTRDDSYWSRHINFRPPRASFFAGPNGSTSLYDLEPYAIGNGLDIGRYVIGWRTDSSWDDGRLKALTDIRNVHKTNNKYVETVLRTELEHQTTERLTTKALLLRHDLPRTVKGIDPFITDGDTGKFLINTAIADGEDPSLNTASLGLKYALTNWMDIHGVWEYTNDFTASADNFPRGLLNDSSFSTYTDYGNRYRSELPFLYSQGYFDLPPYDYFNIFKTGIGLKPAEKWNVYLDYTRNPNKFAGQIDDNIGHVGMEVTYLPKDNLGMFFKYTWSRLYDIYELVNHSQLSLESHHNIYTELKYKVDDASHLSLQYGVGPAPSVASDSFDPFGGSLVTLDTQHIFRLLYHKLF